MAQYETLKLCQADGLLWISFDRPKVMNAFNLAQWRDLKSALDSAAADEEVRVVAICGEGGNFSAGYDLTAALGGDLAVSSHEVVHSSGQLYLPKYTEF